MSNTFTFSDDFGETQNQCQTKISVELKTYEDGRKFYYVNYSHNIIYLMEIRNCVSNIMM